MDFSVKVRGLEDLKRKLAGVSKDMSRTISPGLNRVAARATAEINRAIPEEYAVKASEVRNAVDVRKASHGDLRAVISVFGSQRKRGRSLNMIHFLSVIQAAGRAMKTRGSKAKKAQLKTIANQLGFTIRKDGGLKKIDGAFLGNNGRTIFRRVGKGRLPIEPMQVIGFSQMFRSKKIFDRVIKKIQADLPVELGRVIDRAIKG